ncbi:MAG TPA: alpha-hydroxy-acid oxidizing protein [Spirochaetales bacterium]|nr:alpha-hydroxy-acid oxidizing protein [Spirochaetales bacterium]
MTYNEVRAKAKQTIGPYCKVCPECNGQACKGMIPGPGGKGTGSGFIRNYARLRDIRLAMDTVYEPRTVSTATNLFGQDFELPVFAAPVGAVGLHYSDAYTDLSYSAAVLEGCKAAGSAAFTGDGVKDEVYRELA